MSRQLHAFRFLRRRLAINSLRQLLSSGRLRIFTILATSGFVALLVFALAYSGFAFLRQGGIPFRGLIIAGLFDVLFLTLGAMLLVSTGVILYASLFSSPEARFLLTTPATADRIFAEKFRSAAAFSSWGFVVLGLPVLIAYGLEAGAPWLYFPVLPAFLIGFVLLPAALSSLACLLLMRWLPRNRRLALQLLLGVIVVIAGIWIYRTGVTARDALTIGGGRDALQGFVDRFALASHPLMPGRWMTRGLMAAAAGDSPETLRQLALIWSNGLLAYLIAAFAASRLYRTAYDRAVGGSMPRRRRRRVPIDRLMEALVFYLDKPTRTLVVKDFRTFRRDPSQWALLAIFAGMIALGAGNFRSYYTEGLETIDQYIVGLVNLAGTAVLMCAALSRFVFPLISLEGRQFWILGLTPISRWQILAGKFAYAATGSVLISLVLVVGSELMLGLPLQAIAMHALAAVCIALGLSGLNVGLGAAMPNFRETDPSRIVVGFSGTLNMVVGLLFTVATLALMAGPLHAAAVMRNFGKLPDGAFPNWVYAGLPFGMLLAALASWLPMRAGRKALESTEF